jgi:hypothetical protein
MARIGAISVAFGAFGRRQWRLTGLLATLLGALLYVPPPAAGSPSAAQQLANTYAPIVMMRALGDRCDSSQEQYAPPSPVTTVLGNPRVRLLRYSRRTTRVITRAPNAASLAGRGRNYYLDLPGNPLQPGCKYARDFAALRRAGRAPAVTYAHIARESGHQGFALQFWFFYYFNHFNDLHEGDWEGTQLAFKADTPARALANAPYEIVVFQHSGGEHAKWDDARVGRTGTHPVVYSAAGSHATFYGAALWLGNGQNGSGVGCDNTTTPLITVRPRPILLPNAPVKTGPFAWLSFTGSWGQREAGFNNGPAGPNTKTVWRKPFTWMDGTRSSSPEVPGAATLGPAVSGAFCGVVAKVSTFINLRAQTTPGAIGLAAAIVLLIVVPASLTRWRPTEPQPLRQPRAVGQLLMVAGRLYWRYSTTLLVIVLTAVLIIAALDSLQWLALHALGSKSSGLGYSDSGVRIEIGGAAGIGGLIGRPIASAAIIAFLRALERGKPVGLRAVWRPVFRRLWRLIAVQLLASFLVIALLVTIIGIPYGLRKFVHWQCTQQEKLFEDRSIREALRGSTGVVRGHWWHTAAAAGMFYVLSQIPGPLLGFALLFTTLPITDVDLLGTVIFALLIPYVDVGRTLLYLDLTARPAHDTVPAAAAVAPAATA